MLEEIRQVRVGPHDVRVYWVDEPPTEEHRAEYDPMTLDIQVLTRGRPLTALAEDLVHELLHALVDNSGGDLVAHEKGEDLEERAVELLAPRLLALLRDNPSLIAELQTR